MSKAIAITQIEQQIGDLPPVEQIMMLERIVRNLKRLLLARTTVEIPRAECTGIAEKLNQIYRTEETRMEPFLINAQLSSINRSDW